MLSILFFQYYHKMFWFIICTNHKKVYYYFNKNGYENSIFYNIMLNEVFFVLESQGSNFNDKRMAGTRKWFLIF